MSASVKHTHVWKVNGAAQSEQPDLLAREEPLEIRIVHGSADNRIEKKLAVTMRTPGHDLELALGFLFTEGIVGSYADVLNIRHCETVEKEEERDNVVKVELAPSTPFDPEKLDRNFYTSSSCGVCGKSSIESVSVACSYNIKNDTSVVTHQVILGLTNTVRKTQNVFEYTGGIHASGLFDLQGNLILSREDVGRHNALDKIIGASLFKNEVPLTQRILLVSGRTSFELVQKAARAGIPILAAVGAPSSLAVDLAIENNMTLIGFLKFNRFNVYCGRERVRSSEI